MIVHTTPRSLRGWPVVTVFEARVQLAGEVRASKKARRGRKYASFAEGVKRRKDGKSNSNVKTCSGKQFEYKDDPRNPKQGHAEAKIIEDWFKAGASGTLILNPSKSPCGDCRRLINEVNTGERGKKCNRIVVCEAATRRP